MSYNISNSAETPVNDPGSDKAKVAPAANPPATGTEKKAEDAPPLKS